MFEKYTNSFLKDFNFESLLDKFTQKEFLSFKSGDIIFSENDDVKDIYFLLSGEVNLCKRKNKEETELITTVHAGDIIGFCDALTTKKHYNSAVVIKDTNTFAVDKNELYNVTSKNDEFNLWVLKYLSNRIQRLE
ncbi:MAG: hypothetical protein HGGPFJEG_02078 [Ignavibacteria bacterium]|nr:hypothetical protein [Ignavibacteria bacterium]